jgi:hypothetical protein
MRIQREREKEREREREQRASTLRAEAAEM